MARQAYTKDQYDGDVIGGGFTVYEPGRYDFEIRAVEEGISTSSRTAGQAEWKLRGEFLNVEDDAPFTMWLYPESKGKWRVGQLMEALELEPEETDDGVVVDTEEWLGRVVELTLTKRMHDNKERNDIADGGVRPSEHDPGYEGAMDRRKSLAKGGLTDDDIPF